jgi:hypothetical protein
MPPRGAFARSANRAYDDGMRRMLALLVPLLMGTACPGPADWDEPLGPAEEARLDPDLEREWSCVGPSDPARVRLLVAPFDERQYLLVFKQVEKGEDELLFLRGYTTDAGGHRVMNLQFVGEEKGKWSYARFQRSGDRLRIDGVQPSALEGVPTDAESLRQAIGDLWGDASLWEAHYRCVAASEQGAEE